MPNSGPCWRRSTTPSPTGELEAERAFLADSAVAAPCRWRRRPSWAPDGTLRIEGMVAEERPGGDDVVLRDGPSPGIPTGPGGRRRLGRALAEGLVADGRRRRGRLARGGAAVTVYLVGAGPGDPGLLTRRGADLLARADVVVYDRLVSTGILALARPGAALVDVGRCPGGPGARRTINALLVEHGGDGAEVVRLKGGDPFVFGRGGEEAEALAAAGVPFEVVPGVSSAFAAPAAAGIPVTHRGLSTSVTVVTGRVGDGPGSGAVDWGALAATPGTLVVLMGMAERDGIAAALVAAGRARSTPVAVVHWGTTGRQQVVRTDLDGLAVVDLPPPSVIVVGEVAALDLGDPGTGDEPVTGPGPGALAGATVVVTRARAQASSLAAGLSALGAEVIELPVVEIVDPVDGGAALAAALRRVAAGAYRWVVVTSANGARRMASGLPARDWPPATGLAAVGPATAAELEAAVRPPDVVATEATAAALAAAVPPPDVPGDTAVLFPRAETVSPVLADGLRAEGWMVDEVVAYRTVAARPDRSLVVAAASADIVTFTSPSTVARFVDLMEAHGVARRRSDGPGAPGGLHRPDDGGRRHLGRPGGGGRGRPPRRRRPGRRRRPRVGGHGRGPAGGGPGRPKGTEHGAATTPGDLP